MRLQSSVGLGETYLQTEEFGPSFVLFSYWTKDDAGVRFKKTRGSGIRSRIMSVNALEEQKWTELRGVGYVANVQNPTAVLTANGEVHTRVSTSFCSRSKYVRDCAVARGNDTSPIARQALRRPQILVWVGQRSKVTVDQRREDHHLQNLQFRTSFRSMVIHQFWCLWKQLAIHFTFIFKSCIRTKWRNGT